MRTTNRTTAALVALNILAALLAGSAIGAERVKVGFLSTLSGPGGALGSDIRDGFNLAVKHTGGKLGGLPADVIVVDDQQKPEVGKQAAERMLTQDKVDFMTGMVFSNVLLPTVPAVLEARVFYISPNTGPEDYAGSKCNPYFFVASWENEDIPGAMGKYATEKGYKNVYLIGANYPGGKESIAGFKRHFRGTVADEIYTPMGQLDYAAELAAMQARKPDALFIFLPGGMGINFIKQFVATGANKSVALLLPGFRPTKTRSSRLVPRCWVHSILRTGRTIWTIRRTSALSPISKRNTGACRPCTRRRVTIRRCCWTAQSARRAAGSRTRPP
jgi:branched-chain amino acid transport system substrate-binding protein